MEMSKNLTSKEKALTIISEMEMMVKVMFLQNTGELAYPDSVRCEFLKKGNMLQTAMLEIEQNLKIEETVSEMLKMNEELDEIISTYQQKLQRVDHLLRSAIYYSKQKLKSVKTSRKAPTQSELIFKLSHQISASHGAVAPEGWMQGDPRRPYPIDAEMRSGYLDHIDDETETFRPAIYELLRNSLRTDDDTDVGDEKSCRDSSPHEAVPSKELQDPNRGSPSIAWLSSHSNSPPLLPTDSGQHVVRIMKRIGDDYEDDEDDESSSRTSDLVPETSASTSAVVSPIKSNAPTLPNIDVDESRESMTLKTIQMTSDDEAEEVTEMMSTDEESSSLSEAS